ncbi:MAG: hydroxymethylglutaryl-CoA synthase [Chloroflexota bacterium]
MRIGIEKLDLYAGRCYLELLELAETRGSDALYITEQLMCHQRSVFPIYEDAVTMAVNAVKRLLSPEEMQDIELLIVGTESAVDYGKPISTWVHRLCNLPENCRSFEMKHACYGGTGALKMAASWVQAGIRPGKKALVVSSDYSRNSTSTVHEPMMGGCAVAMIVSAEPAVLALNLSEAGYWTHEIYDTFRPTVRHEITNGEKSMYAYLDALDGAFEHYESIVGAVDYDADFKRHIYHAPFPGITLQAHQSMLNRLDFVEREIVEADFQKKVDPGLGFSKRIGTSYGASTFVCLLSLLSSAHAPSAGDAISLFAYGSGCQGEFYKGTIGEHALERVPAAQIEQHLDQRQRLSVAAYEANELARQDLLDCGDYVPETPFLNGTYEECYQGQELLVLEKVEGYERQYRWS